MLGEERPPPAAAPPPHWLGAYTEPETGLAVRIDARRRARCVCVTAIFPTCSTCGPMARPSDDGGVRLRPGDGGLWMDRPHENQSSRLRPCDGAPAKDVAGRYRCEELDAELTVVDAGGVLYGGFSGFLGQGRMELLGPVGPTSGCCPARVRSTTHRPATGRWRSGATQRAGFRRRGRLLAGPPSDL